MKYAVLTIVGMWFAFVTVVQSFHIFNPIADILLYTVSIGFGYSMFFISLIDAKIPKRQTLTIVLALFCAVLTILGLFHQSFLHITSAWWTLSGVVLLFLHRTRRRKV